MYGSWRQRHADAGHGRRRADHAPQRLEVAPQGQPACDVPRRRCQSGGVVAGRGGSRRSTARTRSRPTRRPQAETARGSGRGSETSAPAAASRAAQYKTPYCPKDSSNASAAKPKAAQASGASRPNSRRRAITHTASSSGTAPRYRPNSWVLSPTTRPTNRYGATSCSKFSGCSEPQDGEARLGRHPRAVRARRPAWAAVARRRSAGRSPWRSPAAARSAPCSRRSRRR